MNAIMPRASIDQVEAYRNQALANFLQAYDLVQEGAKLASLAAPSKPVDVPTIQMGRSAWGWSRSREEFERQARYGIDRAIWMHVVDVVGISTLMDATAAKEFRDQLAKDPPPATAENCLATLEQLRGDADFIFKRGVATAFSKLDRRFRSHDGFKIGSRIVLSHYFSGGSVSSARRDDTLLDVERAFYVLDRKPPPDRYAGILGAIDQGRRTHGGFMTAGQFVAEDEYFRVRVFLNGNAHVWFKREDLVRKVNLLLADYYGAALGAGADVAEDADRPEPSRAMAKNFGAFWSPPAVVQRVIDAAYLVRADTPARTRRVLEPSAGTGAIALAAADLGHDVTCVELQRDLAGALAESGRFSDVHHADFLDVTPGAIGTFDLVLMNPPFDRGLDVDHVHHALDFLAPGGLLVAVMSAGVEFRQDRRTTSLRTRAIDKMGGRFQDLPHGSFAESGTMVNTCILLVRSPQ